MEPSAAVLAFDVGGTTIKAEVLGADLSVWGRQSAPTPRGLAVVDTVLETAHALLQRVDAARRAQVRAVGLAIPGIVDADRGVSVYSANLGLRDAPIAAVVSQRLGLPVHMGHDVAAAAQAEHRIGAARDVADPMVVVIGTGISAVSFVHGRRVEGVTGQAGELGHVVVRPGGPRCRCGNRGCLEAVASAAAVVRAYRVRVGRSPTGAKEVVALLGRDPVAAEVWDEATGALADGLIAAAAILAPGAIVLGGGLAEAGETLLEPVSRKMRGAGRVVTAPPLLKAALGGRAGVVGAGLLALGAVCGPPATRTPPTTAVRPEEDADA